MALDVNGDGVISADELKDAPATLLKLDKNRDGWALGLMSISFRI
jgi:hypothetical protein